MPDKLSGFSKITYEEFEEICRVLHDFSTL